MTDSMQNPHVDAISTTIVLYTPEDKQIGVIQSIDEPPFSGHKDVKKLPDGDMTISKMVLFIKETNEDLIGKDLIIRETITLPTGKIWSREKYTVTLIDMTERRKINRDDIVIYEKASFNCTQISLEVI